MVSFPLEKIIAFCQPFLALPIGKQLIPIPYWSNKLKNGKIVIEGAFGGKGAPRQIQQAVQQAARKEHLDLNQLSQKEIIYLFKRNKIGLDCSGLVYQILDFISQKTKKGKLDHILIGNENQKGIRRVGVKELSDPQNSIPVNFNQVQTGDFIIINHKKHVIFVLNVQKNEITYLHSSQKTKQHGVHLGILTITHPSRGLDHQNWSDQLKDGSPYNHLLHPQDGFYRLKIFT